MLYSTSDVLSEQPTSSSFQHDVAILAQSDMLVATSFANETTPSLPIRGGIEASENQDWGQSTGFG